MKNGIVCGAFDEIETVFDHKFTCDISICVCVMGVLLIGKCDVGEVKKW